MTYMLLASNATFYFTPVDRCRLVMVGMLRAGCDVVEEDLFPPAKARTLYKKLLKKGLRKG